MTNLPSKKVFEESDYQKAIEASKKKDCRSYYSGFLSRYKEAENIGDEVKKQAYGLLSDVTFMELKEWAMVLGTLNLMNGQLTAR